MKKKIICKSILILLVLAMLLPLCAFSAKAASNSTNSNRFSDIMGTHVRTPKEQVNKIGLYAKINIAQLRGLLEVKKPITTFTADSLKIINENLPQFVEIIKAGKKSGDLDNVALCRNILSTLTGIISCCGPYGAIAGAALNLCSTVIKLLLKGEEPTSELAQMEDRLNQKLNEIQNQLSGIEEDIGELSDEINASTEKIISEIIDAIGSSDDKSYLTNFMLSGEGNFSYNQYRNYIYGPATGNSKASTAYYAKLKQSIENGASDDLVKAYYDLLYTAIMDSTDEYYDYIVGTDSGKSIVRCYYDILSQNPDMVDEGSSPELMAIMFAYDIYQTECMASNIIASCNTYQYTYMLLNSLDSYEYNESDNTITVKEGKSLYYTYDNAGGRFVTYEDIVGAEGIDSISATLAQRDAEISEQLARDIAYILGVADSYIVEEENGDLFEIANLENETFGYISSGQRIYLTQIPDTVCTLFGINAADYRYVLSVSTEEDGVFVAEEGLNTVTATLTYKDEPISRIVFHVDGNAKFNGGNGTGSNPYLIATPEQFKSIGEGLDKHYLLIRDIDFGGEQIAPIGQKVNSNGNVVYDSFTGSLDGNGCTLKNLSVVGGTHTGLFGIIGEGGEVSNIKLYNLFVSSEIKEAQQSDSKFYAGIVAGLNNGAVRFIDIDSDSARKRKIEISLTNLKELKGNGYLSEDALAIINTLIDGGLTQITQMDSFYERIYTERQPYEVAYYGLDVSLDNTVKNRCISLYAGGIVGKNASILACCTIQNVAIVAQSSHSFGGDAAATNKQDVYAGGLCGINDGIMGYSTVSESTYIGANALSVYKPGSTVRPYVSSTCAGIVAKADNLYNVVNVESEAVIFASYADLENKSNRTTHYDHVESNFAELIPGHSEEDLKDILPDENVSVSDLIAPAEKNYKVTAAYTASSYVAGNTVKHPFTASQNEPGVYTCNELGYTLTLDEDGTGSLAKEGKTLYFEYKINEDGSIDTTGDSLTLSGLTGLYKDKGEIYAIAPNSFRTDGLTVFIDGTEAEYSILAIYGFDTQNEEFTPKSNESVSLLVAVKKGEKTIYRILEVAIEVGANKLIGTEVIGLKDSYISDSLKDVSPDRQFTPIGLTLKYSYAVGAPRYITVTEEMISSGAVRKYGDTTSYGEQQLVIIHDGESFEFTVRIVCNHGTDFTDADSGYEPCAEKSKAPTCTELGYNAYICSECMDEKRYYIQKAPHAPAITEGYTKPTCQSEGNTGRALCACGEVLVDGKVIPKLNHTPKYIDESTHACIDENGNSTCINPHIYTVTESVQLRQNEDGSRSNYIVYTYTCSCMKGDKHYSFERIDNNRSAEENATLPTIMVNDGYALGFGDEVTVYVQLLNNPGIKAVNFGIRYSEGLELIGVYDGNIITGSLIKEENRTDYGFNFVWAPQYDSDDAYFYGNGNLLKLVFRVLEKEGSDPYEVSVVYGMENDAEGGFTAKTCTCEKACLHSATKQRFVTRSGSIKIVDNLPGDVDRNGTVDLMDAIFIAKYLTGRFPSISEQQANIDLKGGVDVDDLVVLLQYISGGYGTNISTPEFEIILNTNGFSDASPENLFTSVYGGDTYGEAGLPTLTRPGYKFLGWYDRMYGGSRISASDSIVYNSSQKKQTLYAQWEINQLVFNTGDATSGKTDDVYYLENTADIMMPSLPTRVYSIIFKSSSFDLNDTGNLTYAFLKFIGDNGESYSDINSLYLALCNDHYGKIELTPVWDAPVLNYSAGKGYPAWTKQGYDSTILWYGDRECDKAIVDLEDILLKAEPVADGAETKYRIYSKHTPFEFNISFDENEGALTIPDGKIDRPFTVEDTINFLSQIGSSKAGHHLNGWNVYIGDKLYCTLDKNGIISEIVVPCSGTVVVFEADWSGNQFNVYYNANKPGNASNNVTGMPATSTWTYGENATLGKAPSLYGWTFKGWYLESSLTTRVGDAGVTLSNQTLSEKNDVELFAKWEAKTVTVTLSNEFSSGVLQVSLPFDSSYGSLTTPLYSNYEFLGWYTDPGSGTRITSSTKVTNLNNHTLYAHWLLLADSWSNPRGSVSGGSNMTVTDGESFGASKSETVTFSKVDITALKAAGKTKVRLTITFGAKEKDDGYQELYFYNLDTNSPIACRNNILTSSPCYSHVGYGSDVTDNRVFIFETQNSGWHDHTFVFEFNIDALLNLSGAFKMGYGANGKNNDDWVLGATTISAYFYE